jgi:hypothetical protein
MVSLVNIRQIIIMYICLFIVKNTQGQGMVYVTGFIRHNLKLIVFQEQAQKEMRG